MKGVDAMGTTKERTQDVEIKRFYFNIKSVCNIFCNRACYWSSIIETLKNNRLVWKTTVIF